MPGRQTFVQMYNTDIVSIAAASEHTTDSDVELDVSDVEAIAVQVKSTGEDAAISGDLDVKLVGSVDGSNYDTQTFATVTLTQSDNSEERASKVVDVRGLAKVKVTAIENKDAGFASTNVNVFIGKAVV